VKLTRALAMALSCLLLAACSSTGSSPSAPASAPATPAPSAASAEPSAPASQAPASPESTSFRIVAASTPDFTQVYIPYWQDLLEARGLDVEVINVEGGDIAFRTMIAGQGDVYLGGLGHLVNFVQATGEDAKAIAVDAVATDYIIVSQPDIASVADLTGANLGINRPGDSGDAIMRAALKAEGFDPETANFLEIGGTSARVSALLAGQIDAGPAHAAEAFAAVEEGLKNLLVTGDSIGPFPQTALMTTGGFLDEKPVLAQIAVDTFIDALRWAASDKDAYIALSKEVVPDLPDTVRSPAYDVFEQIGLFGVDGGMTPELLDSFVEISLDAGQIQGEIPDQSVWADFSFVEDYLERNGEFGG
jgi:ABC-type nitrate/sulfonate/bicarbonate transport system substrate-binding protein